MIIEIEAEINIQIAVAIVIGYGCASEGALRRLSKAKCVLLLAEPAATLILIKHRAIGPNYHEVLTAIVIKISKQGTRGVFQNAQA